LASVHPPERTGAGRYSVQVDGSADPSPDHLHPHHIDELGHRANALVMPRYARRSNMRRNHRAITNEILDCRRAAQEVAGQRSEKGGEKSPVLECELHWVTAELALQDGDLMPQRQNLHVLVRSLTGSSRSTANAFVTVRQAGRSSTRDHPAALRSDLDGRAMCWPGGGRAHHPAWMAFSAGTGSGTGPGRGQTAGWWDDGTNGTTRSGSGGRGRGSRASRRGSHRQGAPWRERRCLRGGLRGSRRGTASRSHRAVQT
jgi:hypothetical protein